MNKNDKHKIKTLQIFKKTPKINVEKLSKIRSSIDKYDCSIQKELVIRQINNSIVLKHNFNTKRSG